jgi:hypothetical protein
LSSAAADRVLSRGQHQAAQTVVAAAAASSLQQGATSKLPRIQLRSAAAAQQAATAATAADWERSITHRAAAVAHLERLEKTAQAAAVVAQAQAAALLHS